MIYKYSDALNRSSDWPVHFFKSQSWVGKVCEVSYHLAEIALTHTYVAVEIHRFGSNCVGNGDHYTLLFGAERCTGCSVGRSATKAATMSIMSYNGGTVLAMAGNECVCIATDLRLGEQMTTIATNVKKVSESGGFFF
ncbi:unnamed protein product [Toxocara canis]|uniref:Dirigent protein n=1 Tax=Toxocara canis TaxID=6265 RepID=A0A183VF97_TOXCA|nr:unnamed protein product [Toxocara canis]